MIARLDDTDLKLAENSAKAAAAAARSRRDVASDNLERAKALLPKAIISQGGLRYPQERARRGDLRARVGRGAAAPGRQRRRLCDARCRQGRHGHRRDRRARAGGERGPAGHHAGRRRRDGGRHRRAPSRTRGASRWASAARISLWAGPALAVAGRIREIAGQADAASRTYAVRIATNAPPQGMRLGMTATVAIQIEQEAAAMVVPLTALTEADGTAVVFVVDATTKTVRKTPVGRRGHHRRRHQDRQWPQRRRPGRDRRRAVPARRHARPPARRARAGREVPQADLTSNSSAPDAPPMSADGSLGRQPRDA